jgi:hypothetical protein
MPGHGSAPVLNKMAPFREHDSAISFGVDPHRKPMNPTFHSKFAPQSEPKNHLP